MGLFRDSWEVWRRKVDLAIGGGGDPIESKDVTYDGTSSGLSATNVQSAIDEVDSEVSDNTTDITALKAKKFSFNILWSGDASVGGNKELSASIENYDAVMLYYNNGSVSATIPRGFFTDNHGIKVQTFESNTHYGATAGYVDNTHIAVTASQGSTLYFIGIKYNS